MNRSKVVSVLLAALGTFLMTGLAFAEEHAGGTAAGGTGYAALASGIGIAIAVFGGALGQGKTASAALEGIARNPSAAGKLFVPMILGLALIESLVILGWLVCFVKL